MSCPLSIVVHLTWFLSQKVSTLILTLSIKCTTRLWPSSQESLKTTKISESPSKLAVWFSEMELLSGSSLGWQMEATSTTTMWSPRRPRQPDIQRTQRWASHFTNKALIHLRWWLLLARPTETSFLKSECQRFISQTPTHSLARFALEVLEKLATVISWRNRIHLTRSHALERKLTTRQSTQTSSWCKTTSDRSSKSWIISSCRRQRSLNKSCSSCNAFPRSKTLRIQRRSFLAFWSKTSLSRATMSSRHLETNSDTSLSTRMHRPNTPTFRLQAPTR